MDTGTLPEPSAGVAGPALAAGRRVPGNAAPVAAPLQQTGVQTRTSTYGYDGLNRLTSAAESGATTNTYSYAYDKAGNRLDGGRAYDAANQVLGWTYDAAGNLLSDGTTAYTYDALSRALTTGGTSNSYNADGTLVQQGTTRYTQDLAAPLSQILGDGTSTYVYGAERLFAQAGSAKLWYATDALGSVRQTLSDSGAVLGNTAYDPWGVPQQGSVPTFGFTGELQQGANVYLRARWYNSQRGVFSSRDPFAGMPEQPYSLMPYQYGYSAPTTWTDASGRAVSDGGGGGVGPCPAGWIRQGEQCVRGTPSGYWDGVGRAAKERQIRDSVLCGPRPFVDPIAGAPVSCNQRTRQWESMNLGVIVLPGVGTGLAKLGQAAKAAQLACLTAFAAWANSYAQTYENTDVQSERRPLGRNIIELGTGAQYANLISLAATFADATIYGVDTDRNGLDLAAQSIALFAPQFASRIQFIPESYSFYTGPLQNQGDIVVVVAPRRNDAVFEGVSRFIKPGGQVVIVTEDEFTKNNLAQDFAAKHPVVRGVRSTKNSSDSYGVVPGTSIGAPLTSILFTSGTAWEIYIPSW